MPNIMIKNIRFNLDNPDDRELYESLAAQSGSHTALIKQAIRHYLREAAASTSGRQAECVPRSTASARNIKASNDAPPAPPPPAPPLTHTPPPNQWATPSTANPATQAKSNAAQPYTGNTPVYTEAERDTLNGLWSMVQ